MRVTGPLAGPACFPQVQVKEKPEEHDRDAIEPARVVPLDHRVLDRARRPRTAG